MAACRFKHFPRVKVEGASRVCLHNIQPHIHITPSVSAPLNKVAPKHQEPHASQCNPSESLIKPGGDCFKASHAESLPLLPPSATLSALEEDGTNPDSELRASA